MTATQPLSQEALALRVREHIIRMSTDGGCFIGASLSCADLLVHLYTRVLRVTPETVREAVQIETVAERDGQITRVAGLLAAEADGAELGVGQREEALRADAAAERSVEPVERGPSRRQRHLLFEDQMDEIGCWI